jgi:hypothetical protein
MTAKQYLSRIEKLDMLIESKKDELNSFRDTLPALPSQNLSEERVQTSPQKDASFTRSIERVMEMEATIDKYRDERDRIISKIYKLDKLLQIKILYKRYVRYESLNSISKELKYSYGAIKNTHRRALSEMSKLITKNDLL